MSTPISYKQSFEIIKTAVSNNLAFLDAVIKQCQAFVSSNQIFLKNLSKVTLEIPSKRQTGIFPFANNSIATSKKTPKFKGTETTMIQMFQTLSEKIFSNPPGLSTEIETFQTNLIDKLIEIRKDYENQAKNMIMMGDFSKNLAKSAKSELQKAVTKRDTLVKKLEQINSQDDAKQQNIEQTKQDLFNMEKQCVILQGKFNSAQHNFHSNMEDVLTKFELLDRRMNAEIASVFINFSTFIEDIKRSKESSISLLNHVLHEKQMRAELDDVINAQSQKTQKTVPEKLPFVLKPLSFDPAKFLGDQAFENEDVKFISASLGEYNAQEYDEISLEPNEKVAVLGSVNERLLVHSSTKTGLIPPTSLKTLNCTFTPRKMTMKSDYRVQYRYLFKKGETVFVRTVYDGTAYVVSNSYDEFEIPVSYLE